MNKGHETPVERIARNIVDKRKLIFILYAIALVCALITISWVEVENDITTYLGEETETRRGVEVMNENFQTFGSAKVMLSNITFAQAEKVAEQIKAVKGVSSLQFEDSLDYYKEASALFVISFEGTGEDALTLKAMEEIRVLVAPYDSSVATDIGFDMIEQLAEEMQVILVVASVIIILVLLFTSKTYAEIPILVLVFGVAAILNIGTHFIVGKISFISNSVAIVLQLALAID